MDVREKMVELIESARYWGSNTSEEIADNLLDSGVTVQEWISVDDRLPKGADGKSFCETVIAYLNNGKIVGQVCTGWLNRDKWYLTAGEDDYYTEWGLCDVTHWIPLPEPPKED